MCGSCRGFLWSHRLLSRSYRGRCDWRRVKTSLVGYHTILDHRVRSLILVLKRVLTQPCEVPFIVASDYKVTAYL